MNELTNEQRTALLAQLSPGQVDAIKDVLKPALSYKRVDFADPQWAGRMAYAHGESELALVLIRAIDKAKETMKAKEAEKANG